MCGCNAVKSPANISSNEISSSNNLAQNISSDRYEYTPGVFKYYKYTVFGKEASGHIGFVGISENNGCEFIPFISTMKDMGATIKWETPKVAKIDIFDISYTLDLQNLILYENSNPSINLFEKEELEEIPDFYCVLDKEILIDTNIFARITSDYTQVINDDDHIVSILHEDDKVPWLE